MARKGKSRRSKRSKKTPRFVGYAQRTMRSSSDLGRAAELASEGKWQEARGLLEALYERRPKQPEVLKGLLDVYNAQRDYERYLRVARRLVHLAPNDRFAVLFLAGGYLHNGCALAGVWWFRHFLQRWGHEPEAEIVREQLADIEAMIPLALELLKLEGDDAFERGLAHEEVYAALMCEDFDEAIRQGERRLNEGIELVSIRNNVAEACFRSGRRDEAVAAARRTRESYPDNVHAISNLTRYLFLQGQVEEAQQVAARLRELPPPVGDGCAKKAEAFAWIGDDEGVLEALGDSENDPEFDHGPPPTIALTWHLAAAAALRLGDEPRARRLWRRALEAFPEMELAAENLADLDKPPAERDGPWFFSVNYWWRQEEFRPVLVRLKEAGAAERGVARAILKESSWGSLLPAAFDRGDPHCRRVALLLATAAATEASLEALREFAYSQRGPDKQRIDAATTLRVAGALNEPAAPMYIDGQWQGIECFTFEVTDEPGRSHCDEVEELAMRASYALSDGDGQEAERLLLHALEIEPDAPDLRNNLCQAWRMQGRDEEALKGTRELHREHPDYLFARVELAREAIRARDAETAKELLAPLRQRPRLHTAEFVALATAEIERCLLLGKPEAAERWLAMWESVNPEHYALEILKSRVQRSKAIGDLGASPSERFQSLVERSKSREP